MIKSLFGWGKETVEAKVVPVEEVTPVKMERVYNIVTANMEVWEDDGNDYEVLHTCHIEGIVTGRISNITLSDVNYMRRCHNLPTWSLDGQPSKGVYLATAWFYDKCKEIYYRGK